jgi:hypothetical protein
MRDESLLNQASLQAAQNQLEAERILSRREIDGLRARGAELLCAPGTQIDAPFAPGPWGAARWDMATGTVFIRLSGLSAPSGGGDYQVWVEGSGPGYPRDCGLYRPPPAADSGDLAFHLGVPLPPECRILLIDGIKGGAPTLDEAEAKGSIVLASLPERGKISN